MLSKSNDWAAAARAELERKTKPPGSLGVLEDIAVQLAHITQSLTPVVARKRLCLFAASHGVAAAGVSAYPAVVTGQMLRNFLHGGAAINVLARHAGVELHLIDVGVDAEPVAEGPAGFFARSVRRGTRNFLTESAMTEAECAQALAVGREQVHLALREGVALLGLGEMGIGNTTSASALCSALLGLPPKISVGRGTGVDEAGLQRKISAVTQALKIHADAGSPQGWLAAVGGYEIAAMTGLILAAAEKSLPVVVDGFVATAAAVVARRMEPASFAVCFFAHQSAEQPHATVLPLLNVRPILQLGLRLGEGTGAILAMPIIEAAAKILGEMATFTSAQIASADAPQV